jgi:hypothetical protein
VSALNDHGIYSYGSNDNSIYHNNFINEGTKDDGNNQWDNGVEGNYWSDYRDQGIRDEDGDGIGDTSYVIPDGVNEDRFPLMEPYGGNLRPIKPVISGPSDVKTGQEYEYSASTIDPNGDKLYYFFDWGDGSDSGWIEKSKASHIWTNKGTSDVRVKAKDEHSAESEWSNPLSISMSKSKAVNRPILNFLENCPVLFQLLQRILQTLKQ